MSYRTHKGRMAGKSVRKIEWIERPVGATSAAARAIVTGLARGFRPMRTLRRRRNMRTAGLVGIEYKCVDQTYGPTALTTSWAGGEHDPAVALCIGPSVQGTGLANRDGQRVIFKSIMIEGYVNRPLGSDQADIRGSSVVRVALVQDMQTNAAQLNAEDVYDVTGVDALSRRVLEYSSRFKVLWTQTFALYDNASFNDAAATASVTGPMIPFRAFIKLNVPVTFIAGAGAGTIADFRDNSFHVIACSSGTNDTLYYNTRTRFVG